MSITALAIPEKINGAIKPKPTKAEIIDAMVALKVEQLSKARKEAVEERKMLAEKIETKLRRYVAKNLAKLTCTVDFGYRKCKYEDGKHQEVDGVDSVDLRFDVRNVPAELFPLFYRYYEAKRIAERGWDEKDIRKMVKETLEGVADRETRVQSLLDSPESRKGLEAMMEHCGI